MKHKLGNSPKCVECYWYREKQDGDGCSRDGWCVNEYNCAHDVSGKKRSEPLERESVRWNCICKQWEDAESRLTSYEVLTRQPEPWRTPIERAQIKEILEGN